MNKSKKNKAFLTKKFKGINVSKNGEYPYDIMNKLELEGVSCESHEFNFTDCKINYN